MRACFPLTFALVVACAPVIVDPSPQGSDASSPDPDASSRDGSIPSHPDSAPRDADPPEDAAVDPAIDAAAPDAAAPDAGPAPAHPNEPGGLHVIVWNDFDVVPSAGSRPVCPGGSTIGCFMIDAPSPANYSVVPVDDAPSGDRSALRIRWPSGLRFGTGPGNFGAWETSAGVTTGVEHDEIYESGTIFLRGEPRPDGSFSNDFMVPCPGMKLWGFIGVGARGASSAANQVYPIVANDTGGMSTATTRAQTSFRVSWAVQGAVAVRNYPVTRGRSLTPNRSGPRLTTGAWHRYELHLVVNTLGGPAANPQGAVADGVFQFWIDGVMVTDYADVVYRDATDSHGFYFRSWSPTFGGGACPADMSATKPRTDVADIGELYISAR